MTSTKAALFLSQTFKNQSGGDVTVYEIGIYSIHRDSGGADRHFCIARDLVSGGAIVPNNAIYVFAYTIEATA